MTTSDPTTRVPVAEVDRSEPRSIDPYEIVETLRAIVISNMPQHESGRIKGFRRARSH
ncbi:MAG: hypothetical protein ACRDKZ_16235 [Actinomycetota bacterium]